MRVAVVILNWNGKDFLKQFLPTLISNSEDAHIYVADNASSDGSVAFVREHFPTVSIIQNAENLGFAGGYDEALRSVNEEFYVLLNSDVEVGHDWLRPMTDLMDSDREIAVCQPKMLQFNNRNMFEYAGASGGFIDKLGYPFCRGRVFDVLEEDRGQYDDVCEVFWASGACMMIRKDVFWELGGLDADFFAHMEEIDLCWRAKRAGHRIMVQPKSTVYHVGGGTLARNNPWKTFLNFRNGLEMMTKNLPKRQLIWKILVRLLLDGAAAMRFLFAGQPKNFWAVFKAHMAYYRRLPTTMRKRTGPYPQLTGTYRRSIVFDHFVHKLKKFSALSSGDF